MSKLTPHLDSKSWFQNRGAPVYLKKNRSEFLWLVFLALFFTILPSVLLAETFQGKVVGVSDGDTITVMRKGVGEKIRLNGIDAPEKSQDFGQAAKRFVSNACFGKFVTVKSFGTDKYGRTIGDVRLENRDLLNHLIIKNGYAWWYRKYAPNDRVLSRLEAEAKSARRGLWSQSGAIAPWEYRRGVNGDSPVSTLPNGRLPIIGNRNSRIYHWSTCPGYLKVSPKNRVPFASREEAERAGFRAARNCR